MDNTLYICDVIYDVLKTYKISVQKKDIYEYLHSDDSFPSALSILNTLSIYGIHCDMYELNYAQLCEYKKTAVVHCSTSDGHFYIFSKDKNGRIVLKDTNKIRIKEKDFLGIWDGYAILVEDAHPYAPTVSENKIKLKYLAVISLFLLLMINFFNINMTGSSYQLLIDYIGLFLTYFGFKQSILGFFELPLCHIGNRFDCTKVRTYHFFDKYNINLSLLGFFYFIFDIIGMRIISYVSITSVIFIISALFVTVTILLQIFAIKKICLFCLCISILVYAKLVILLLYGDFGLRIYNLGVNVMMPFLGSLILTYVIWSALNYEKKRLETAINILRFKRNKELFDFLLAKSNLMNLEVDLIAFGAEKPMVTIKTILSPKCHYCEEVVKKMLFLLENNSDIVRWVIYFDGVYFDNINDLLFNKFNYSQLATMQTYRNSSDLLFNQFKKGNAFSSKDRYMKIDSEIVEILKKQLINIRFLAIEQTPIVIYNNYVLPKEYDINDLGLLISNLRK